MAVGYPACAGIDRLPLTLSPKTKWLPRMRGDRPAWIFTTGDHNQATPHARGSTLYQQMEKARAAGYPACAGIDLK